MFNDITDTGEILVKSYDYKTVTFEIKSYVPVEIISQVPQRYCTNKKIFLKPLHYQNVIDYQLFVLSQIIT